MFPIMKLLFTSTDIEHTFGRTRNFAQVSNHSTSTRWSKPYFQHLI